MDQLLIGPFAQALTMTGLPARGPLRDADLTVLEHAGILIADGKILEIAPFEMLVRNYTGPVQELTGKHTVIPGIIDAHTHICFAGSRARDYAMRNAGSSYQEIAKAGGGIWDTVVHTREAREADLARNTVKLAKRHMRNGTTTLEVKSGYGLSVSEELKMLRAIREANAQVDVDLVPTCLAAHIAPKDFDGGPRAYLEVLAQELLPLLRLEGLAQRIDGFVEENAFRPAEITPYFEKARSLGFTITVHADQFTTGGSAVAVAVGAISADHLEASGPSEIELLAKSTTIATALPGASLGLGCAFTPARKILDAGGILAIASDHNPGSAPMGDLLTQASILGAFEKLTNTEVLSGVTLRGAQALGLYDRGSLAPGMLADLAVFHTGDYRDIPYFQGDLKPCTVIKRGITVYDKHGS